MKLSKKVIAVSIVLIFMVTVALMVHFRSNSIGNNTPPGLVLESGYHYVGPGGGTCEALTPSCGFCEGQVINQQCYVKPNSPYAEH